MTARVSEFPAACAALLLITGSAHAQEGATQPPAAWPDTLTTRVEALALLETLNADLLSNDSATLTLDRWCGDHKIASPAKIVAELVHGSEKAATDEVRQLLGVTATDPVRYRRVRLHCGAHVLSEADNWYVPARLTPDMNHVLDTTDPAFGRAVQALHFHRRTLSAKLLWSPLPQGWEMGAATPPASKGPLQIPSQTIEHRAVLSLPDATPFSVVVETYTNEVLAFPKPPRP
jgi:chorismate-pyruvate lyase